MFDDSEEGKDSEEVMTSFSTKYGKMEKENELLKNEILKKEQNILALMDSVNSLKRQNRILADCKSKNSKKYQINQASFKESEKVNVCGGYFQRFIQFLVSFVLFICAMLWFFDERVLIDSIEHNVEDLVDGNIQNCYSICQ